MKKSDASQGQSASELISKRIVDLGDWRGETLGRMRRLIKEADPAVIEEWKWMGTPVWSHDGIICTGESYKSVVKLTFAKGASLKDPARLFNSVSTGTCVARSTSTKAKKLTGSPSKRSFAKRSPSTALVSRNLRRKRSLKKFHPPSWTRRRASPSSSVGRPSRASGDHMTISRRLFIGSVATAVVVASTRASGQQAGRVPRVAFVANFSVAEGMGPQSG